jgi:Uma2 family endonuclease
MGALQLDDLPNYTYDDYLLWEGEWELIFGVAYAMSPAPMIKHQSISSNIAWQLKELFKECKKCHSLLPVDWKIDEETVVQPDNLVICHTPREKAYLTKAPKIIFEILSKSTATKDKNLKYNLYEQEGVQYYIIVNPDDNVAKVYRLHEGKYIKMLDASDESVEFEVSECNNTFSFDFSKIW